MTTPDTPLAPIWPRLRPPASRPPLLRLVPPLPEGPVGQQPLPAAEDEDFSCPDSDLDPEVERATISIVRVLAEVLTGRRPTAQLRPALVPRVAHLIDHLVRSRAAEGMRLAGLRVQSPREGVVEVAGRLASPQQSTAFALRVEKRPRRWAVTALEAALDLDGRVPARF